MSPSLSPVLDAHEERDPEPEVGGGRAERGLLSPAALETVYRSHAARLTRRLARWVSREEARDAVHEAFAKIAASPGAQRARLESPEAYVTTVATNVLRDNARAAARRALRVHDAAHANSLLASDPHKLMESREALHRIEQALAEMPARRARIFSLHRFRQMTYAQIATEVGMSEKAVKKQIAKALVELRRAVGTWP